MDEWKRSLDMTVEEKKALVCAFIDGEEVLQSFGNPEEYPAISVTKKILQFYNNYYYKIVRKKPSAPWGCIDSKYNWIAFDEGGECWAYENKPKLMKSQWQAVTNCIEIRSPIIIKEVGNWKHSLVGRYDEPSRSTDT